MSRAAQELTPPEPSEVTRTIWKFSLSPSDETRVQMPRGAKVLLAREQADNICVWAVVDPREPLEWRVFHIIGTGHDMRNVKGDYIGTASLLGGRLIFHVYDAGWNK